MRRIKPHKIDKFIQQVSHINTHKSVKSGRIAHKTAKQHIIARKTTATRTCQERRAKSTTTFPEVIEEKLPQGSMGWREVSALYQLQTQEDVIRDHEDIKKYWAGKLCNKFNKPRWNPGDQTRDRILRCQRIHQSVLQSHLLSSWVLPARKTNIIRMMMKSRRTGTLN